MVCLRVNDLSVVFDKGTARQVQALSNIFIELERGEITFVLGHNGSGKTTLLRAILGMCPSRGSIELNDRSVVMMTNRQRASAFAYWPQHLRNILPDSMTLLELFCLASNKYRVKRLRRPPHATRQHAQQVIDQIGLPLQDKLDLPVSQFSGGEMASAQFLLSFAADSDVLLMDEPTIAIDQARREKLERCILDKARSTRTTLIWVTHDVDLAIASADRIVVLKQGKVAMNLTRDIDSSRWNAYDIYTHL